MNSHSIIADAAEPFRSSPTARWPVEFRPWSAWCGHAQFAFWLVEALRPRSIVELGTHFGLSYMAFCQAVNTTGIDAACTAVDTWEGDAHAGTYDGDAVLSALKAAHDPAYGRFSRLMRTTFDQAAASFADGSVDLLHIDGLHSYEAVRHDYETWLPKMSDRGVILFHDTEVRERNFGVHRLWAEVSKDRPSFNFTHSYGLGVLGTGDALPRTLSPLFDAAKDPHAAADVRNFYSALADRTFPPENPGPLRRALSWIGLPRLGLR